MTIKRLQACYFQAAFCFLYLSERRDQQDLLYTVWVVLVPMPVCFLMRRHLVHFRCLKTNFHCKWWTSLVEWDFFLKIIQGSLTRLFSDSDRRSVCQDTASITRFTGPLAGNRLVFFLFLHIISCPGQTDVKKKTPSSWVLKHARPPLHHRRPRFDLEKTSDSVRRRDPAQELHEGK